jgi:hypothetical protein
VNRALRTLLVSLAMAASAAATGCSVGQGTGDVYSQGLFARGCWGTAPPAGSTQAVGACYDMQPDFFAADPTAYNTLQIRVQRGSDLTEVSDGLIVNIDDIATIRAAISAASADGGTSSAAGDAGDAGVTGDAGTDGDAGDWGLSDGGVLPSASCNGSMSDQAVQGFPSACDTIAPPTGAATFRVDLPAGIHPPGSPTVPPPDIVADPPLVHMSLYLERSCHNQNITLDSLDGWIAFSALFDGDPDETSADQKLTDATFYVELGDPHDAPFGAYAGDVPPGLRSRFCGSFRFYFERGQPAQPFP